MCARKLLGIALAHSGSFAMPRAFKMRMLFGMLLAVVLVSYAGGSSVTLTGSCPQQIVSSVQNVLVFNLTNSGNGTATNLYLYPVLSGASTFNNVVQLPVIAPGAQYSENFYLRNFSLPGSYVEYFIANYTQGAANFSTFFTCMMSVNHSAPGPIHILYVNRSNGAFDVILLNYFGTTINATMHVQVPSSFSVNSSYSNVVIGPYMQKAVSFNITLPKYTEASFPVAVDVSYESNGEHYATNAEMYFLFGGSSHNGFDLAIIAMAAVVIILMLLIIFSVLKKRASHAVQDK